MPDRRFLIKIKRGSPIIRAFITEALEAEKIRATAGIIHMKHQWLLAAGWAWENWVGHSDNSRRVRSAFFTDWHLSQTI